MSINGIGNTDSFLYKNVDKSNRRKTGVALFERAEMTTASNPQECQSRRFSVNDAYNSMRMNGRFRSEIGEQYLKSLGCSNVNLWTQSEGEVQKVENERYVIDTSDGIAGYWCIYDKESDRSFTFDPRSTSIQTDENTEIECLKVKRQEGEGSWLMIGDQQQSDRLQELANLYKEKYPNLVNDDGLAMGLATAEVAGQVKRTENGIMIIACNGIQYMDNNDQSKGWGFMFSENDTDIYNEIMKAIKEGSIKGGIESVSGWEEWFKEKGHFYEIIFSDEELAVMTNRKDVKNDANFISKTFVKTLWERKMRNENEDA